MRQFILKMSVVLAAIASVLVLTHLVQGDISLFLGILILPCVLFITYTLFLASIAKPKQNKTQKRVSHVQRQAAYSSFNVANASHHPGGGKAA